MQRTYLGLFFLLVFTASVTDRAHASSTSAFNSLDKATTKMVSARLFVANDPVDYAAADNNLRKAKLDIAKALTSSAKGSGKLSGKSLTSFTKHTNSLTAQIDQARALIGQRKAIAASNRISKAIKSIEGLMKVLRGYSAGDSLCLMTFSLELLVTDVYKTHITTICPYVYDEVVANFGAGEIGSLSYGYSNFGGANEDASSCSENGITFGICEGVQGRPGGSYAMRLNVYMVGASPSAVRVTVKRAGAIVDQQELAVQ